MKVNFMTACRQKGVFVLSVRADIQSVKFELILDWMVPDCLKSEIGRQWPAVFQT